MATVGWDPSDAYGPRGEAESLTSYERRSAVERSGEGVHESLRERVRTPDTTL